MIDCFNYRATSYFSELVCDYVEKSDAFNAFISRFPSVDQFKPQLEDKAINYKHQHRPILVDALKKAYQSVETSELTLAHIEALNSKDTFSITTGHQLNLFTGPLYFFYKIISSINLCEELKKTYPEYNFVPVYWMASEDHDFDEINYFNFKREKMTWESSQKGAVGKFSTQNLNDLLPQLSSAFGNHQHAEDLLNLFQQAYIGHETLAEAHFYLVNQLFGQYGLVVLQPNTPQLKQLFASYIKEDLLKQSAHDKVTQQTKNLEDKGYKSQVNPREINLFYLDRGIRERIVKENNLYKVLETDLKFTESEILQLVDDHPERFSPNVVMRPLYQEVILPNLCYIGGGGELAYWLQLKSYFDSQEVLFPILLLRNSVLLYSDKTAKKLSKLKLSIKDLFKSHKDLTEFIVKRDSKIDIDFTDQIKFLQNQFKDLYQTAMLTDASFEGAVAAQEQKQINGLQHLEKRLLKAQKRKMKDKVKRATSLQEMLFPQAGLQERFLNFSEVYVDDGRAFIGVLKENLKPLELKFTAIELNIYNISSNS